MKIYDEQWNEISEPDLNLGWLEDTQRFVKHHEAISGAPATYTWGILEGTEELYPGGLKYQMVQVPEIPGADAWDEYEPCQVYHPYPEESMVDPDAPTDMERLEAQILYTAMMTDTLLQEEEL